MPANTPRGYPYPLPVEPVAEGAQAIRNLAEKIEAAAGMDVIGSFRLTTAGDFTFSAIPAIYSHLTLELYARSSGAGVSNEVAVRVNGDATAAYFGEQLLGLGGSAAAANLPGTGQGRLGFCPGAGAPGVGAVSARFPGYREALGFKPWLSQSFSQFDAGNYAMLMVGGFWNNVAAINALRIFPNVTPFTFAVGSVATLYGLR